ncbi:MAG: hypothetical protein PHN88_07470 [Ignavibacteria bacterium]|nr:hypothetical protein [Ignavibacteria bacterium]
MKTLNIVSAIIISFLIVSCDNNPVSTKREFLPPLYNWSVDTFNIFISDFFIIDSNSYFALSGNNLIYNSNGIVTNSYIGAVCNTLDGTGPNNIILGGSRAYNQSSSVPVLLRYSNGSISDLYVGTNPDTDNMFFCVRFIDDMFWCGTTKGEVVTVSGNNVNHYDIDSSYYILDIMKDNSSVVYAYAGKQLRDTNGFVTGSNFRLYSFSNNEWNLVYNENISGVFNFYEGITNHIFCLKPKSNINETFEYIAGNFTKILDENSTGVWTNLARGKSLTDILICGGPTDGHNLGLYYWDGMKTSEEIFDMGFFEPITMKYKNGRYYVLFRLQLIVKSLLIKGKLKI